MEKRKVEKILVKIAEWLGMIIAIPLAILVNVYGLAIGIGVVWIMLSNDTEEMEPGELAARVGAMVLLVSLVRFVIKRINKNK